MIQTQFELDPCEKVDRPGFNPTLRSAPQGCQAALRKPISADPFFLK